MNKTSKITDETTHCTTEAHERRTSVITTDASDPVAAERVALSALNEPGATFTTDELVGRLSCA